MTSPPFSCPLSAAAKIGLDFLRVAATLDSGDSTEEVLFLGNRAPEAVDVRLVELFVSVYNANGRPVVGLGPADFRVLENGDERQVAQVASLADLPLSVTVLLDVSSSMGRKVHLVGESAQRFFRNILTADDEASLLAFNHDLHQLVPFTSDVGRLEHGATGLRAWGSTRLHDGLVWALSQFAGQENRRALVVLSDGADVVSDFPFPQVLFAARQAGVAVYAISLAADGMDDAAEATSRDLRELANRTGGSFFAVESLSQLDTVYRRIEEELRSQYLLTYTTEAGAADLTPGTLDVQMTGAGLTARAVHGYYQ
jgi:Ca-activated chloride channel family protein